MNLKELATSLGLSQTTVSRALNGYPEVSEPTRQRVLAAAERTGYRPNVRAKALATGRSMTIAHVIPQADRHEIVNPIFADFIAGAATHYGPSGYDILLSVADADGDARLLRDFAAKRTVDGVILHAPRRDDARIGLLRELGMPFVVHGRASDLDDDYSWVDTDNLRSFRRATEFLVDLGHSRIALVNGLEYMDYAWRRRAGYLAGLEARGLSADPALMLTGEMTEAYGHAAACRLVGLETPPTAILSASTITAFGIRRAAIDAGMKLGRDLSVITYDDDLSYFRNGGKEVIFTALRSSVREAGRCAAEAVIRGIGDAGGTARIMLETEFIIGQSTGPAPRASRLRRV